MDFVSQFIEKMRQVGCGPAHPGTIVADDKKYRYQIEDETGTKKSGRYQLKIEGDFCVGWFLDFRQGHTHPFTSSVGKNKSTVTPEEWASFKAAREVAMKAQLEQRRADHAKAAKKAAQIWDKADREGTTEYLVRKGVELNGARLWRKNIVVVPVKVDGKLTSLQFIAEDGNKRFLTGSELVGGYFSIAEQGDDISRIMIVEGFATGCSIREATGAIVVVAFNSGNLLAVAKKIRSKYPESEIIFCADNDQY